MIKELRVIYAPPMAVGPVVNKPASFGIREVTTDPDTKERVIGPVIELDGHFTRERLADIAEGIRLALRWPMIDLHAGTEVPLLRDEATALPWRERDRCRVLTPRGMSTGYIEKIEPGGQSCTVRICARDNGDPVLVNQDTCYHTNLSKLQPIPPVATSGSAREGE